MRKRNNLKCNGFRSAFVLFCSKVCSYIFVTNENDKMKITNFSVIQWRSSPALTRANVLAKGSCMQNYTIVLNSWIAYSLVRWSISSKISSILRSRLLWFIQLIIIDTLLFHALQSISYLLKMLYDFHTNYAFLNEIGMKVV